MKKNKNIMAYSRQLVKENNKIYCEGFAYKLLKVLFVIVAIYCIMGCLATMIAYGLDISHHINENYKDSLNRVNESKNIILNTVIPFISAIACIVLLKIKSSILLAVFGCVNCITSFMIFYAPSVKNDVIAGGLRVFWTTFGVPSLALAVFSLLIGTLMFLDYCKIKKVYDDYTAELYSKYSENGTKALSAEDFEKIMNEYKGEEVFRTDIPLKKSLRKRKEKQDLKQNNN